MEDIVKKISETISKGPYEKDDSGNAQRVPFLESKEKGGMLTAGEAAELKSRREIGDNRIAFLESRKAVGSITAEEFFELRDRKESLQGKKRF
jgi:hypothetical protein